MSPLASSPSDPGRALLGAWGLGSSQLPAALAAAGVLAGRWRQLKPELDAGRADLAAHLAAHLAAALTIVKDGRAVRWRDPFTRSGWRQHETALTPDVVAAAWQTAVLDVDRRGGPGPDEPIRLTIDAHDATARPWPLPWLSTVLAQADWQMAAAVERERSPDRVHWDWPLAIGLPPTPGGVALGDGLQLLAEEPGGDWLAATTRRSLLRARTTTSLLVLPGQPDEWSSWVTSHRPTAEVALALCDTTEQLERAVATLLPHRQLRAVAGMLAPDPADTLRWVLRELTHDALLDTALAHNGDPTADARYVVHGDPDALLQLRLRTGMRRTAALLSDVAALAGAEPAGDTDDADLPDDADVDLIDDPSDGEEPMEASTGGDAGTPARPGRGVTIGPGEFERPGTAPRRRPPVPRMVSPPQVSREVARRRPELADASEHFAELAEDGHFLREADGAVPLSEGTEATRALVEDAGPVRFVQARVHDADDEPVQRFTATVDHTVAVFVGPPERQAVSAPQPFPDELLEPGRTHRLTVVLACPDLDPAVQVDTITLPPVGRSEDDAQFRVRPPAGRDRLEARIAVLHGNRVLQSWMLDGPVTAPDATAPPDPDDADDARIRLRVEAMVRARTGDLHRRRGFDGAVIVNHDHTSRARATVIGDGGGDQVDLDAPALRELLDEVVAELDLAIEDVEGHDSLDDEQMRQLLVLLANRGSVLRNTIVEQLPSPPDPPGDGPRRLQVLSARAEAYLPLELLYDPPAPRADATVCADARAVLTAGADGPCPAEHDRDVVCPLGFWGLNSVIERHTWSPGALETGWAVDDEPTEGRDVIRLDGPVLVGASHRVDAVADGTVQQTLDDIRAAADTTAAGTWQQWVDAVAADAPDLLIALPHTVNDRLLGPSLTIGTKAEESHPLGSGHIDTEHVRTTGDGHTVVVLFGCETADPGIPFLQFPAAFRRARAQVVVGTLTRVVGRHAGPLAAELATGLLSTAPEDATTLGEALRDLRRRHLDGFGPVVLALVAYGDADWIIEGGDEGTD